MGFFKCGVFLLLVAHTIAVNQTFKAYLLETITKTCPFQRSCLSGMALPYNGSDSKVPCCQECSCEEYCSVIGACCFDNFLSDSEVSTTLNVGCHPFAFIKGTNLRHVYAYLVVNKCPKEYDDHYTANLCNRTHPETMKQAQFVSDDSGRIYRNVYCARCNRVRDFIEWRFNVTCPDQINDIIVPETELQYLLNNLCTVWLEEPKNRSFHALRCYTADISSCNVTGKWRKYNPYIEEACKTSQTGHYLSSYTVYKNVFCFQCNSIDGLNEVNDYCSDNGYIGMGLYTFTAILNFDDNSKPVKDHDVIPCQVDEIYDGLKDICRELKCPPMSYPTNGICRSLYQRMIGYGLWIASSHKLIILNSNSTPGKPLSTFNPPVIELSTQVEDHIRNVNSYECELCGYFLSPDEHALVKTINVFIHLRTTISCQLSEITKMAERFKRVRFNMTINNIYFPFASQYVTKAYLQSAFSNIASPGGGFHQTVSYCPTTMLLFDNSCAHIVLNGVEYLDALINNHIKQTNHHSQYERLRQYNISELQNTSYDICADEYIVTHYVHGCALSIAILSAELILTQTIMILHIGDMV